VNVRERRVRQQPRVEDPVDEHAFETGSDGGEFFELVVCSLEPWDEIWRRNQFLVDELLRRHPGLRVLFVEPPADVLFDVTQRRRPDMPRFRRLSADGRLTAFRPLKALPRRLGPPADALLLWQLRLAVRRIGFERPVLWINDVTYAPLIQQTGWPSLYDVTDDWLLAPLPPRELERLRRLDAVALAHADEVVVCSSALATSRGTTRPVTLVPNGVDVDHFRRPRPRPPDLPAVPTAVYVGSLHDARLDVELVVELADALPQLNVVLVGPDSLGSKIRSLLASRRNVSLLGAKPYEDVPAYLQHADVIIVPHRVTPFTDSLDPIKAYECLAIATPTVATPVAGFRECVGELNVAATDEFSQRVADILSGHGSTPRDVEHVDWSDRALAFERALARAALRERLAENLDDRQTTSMRARRS
jgi:glycosyltransferase involved in cell wall biosynthesis